MSFLFLVLLRTMRTQVISLTLCILVLAVHGADTATGTQPYVVVWNTTSYGPDGPWQVVTVDIGDSQVDLYPSGIWETIVNSDTMCTGPGTCPAAAAGLYDEAKSQNVIANFTDIPEALGRWGSGAAMNIEGKGVNLFDTLNLESLLQGSTNIYNSTIFAASALNATLPDGSSYPLAVGSLSLGAWLNVQTWGQYQGLTIPGFLKDTNRTASNSFGLHYGSALLGLGGSLVFGGYDQGRVLGDVGSFDLGVNGSMALDLIDIGIGVDNGISPFNVTSANGLLKMNASQNSLPTTVNPLVAYFFLPPETCAAIAEFLPITLASDIGLYKWNTADPAYQKVLSAPTYLDFVFQSAGSSGGNLSIKVPLQLLNLTLEAPIVPTPERYFPCRPYSPVSTQDPFLLGKAFLQAAFIGMNWELEKYFLAQAPGPSIGPSQIQEIGSGDTNITSNPISDFSTTWAKDWAPISDSVASNTTKPNGSSLTSGAKAGIGVGVALGIPTAVAILLYFLAPWRRRARTRQQEEHSSEGESMVDETQTYRTHEIGAEEPKETGKAQAHEISDGQLHEIGGKEAIHEMDVLRNQ